MDPVAPELVGKELASPSRRLGGMLLDLACVGIASQLGFAILAAVAGIGTWRAAGRQVSPRRRRIGRAGAVGLACVGLTIAVSHWGSPTDLAKVKVDGEDVGIVGSETLSVLPDVSPIDVALARSYVDALAAGDAPLAAELRPRVAEQVAGPELSAASQVALHARETNRELLADLEEARTPLYRRGIRRVADTLGLGIGWSAVYFTLLTAAWNGQTVGKRLLRTRVVRLDGKPITWWTALNRYGGYAASAFLGLLGFARIITDPHRQALHDKAVATVVIRA